MMNSTELIDFNDQGARARYDTLFESCPHAYIQQSTYWADVISKLGPHQDIPLFLICSRGGIDVAGLPLYLYEHPLGNSLSSVPHAGPLGGVFLRPGMEESAVESIYESLVERAIEIAIAHEALALTIISNPFIDDFQLYQKFLLPTYGLENFTQYVDLPSMIDEAGNFSLQDYNRRSNLSRNLKKAAAAGFTIKDCETPAELEELFRVHCQRHAELNAQPLEYKMFQNIHRYLVPVKKARLMLVMKDNELASGSIYIRHQKMVDVLRLNMNSKFAELSPNFLNTDESLRYYRREGCTVYNWQSSPSRESGVYRYKKQWGSLERRYYILSRLFCPAERIEQIGLERLKSEYPMHFVVPYAVFTEGFSKTVFTK